MSDKIITINNIRLPLSSGEPVTFHGKHSGKDLAGINLEFIALGEDSVKKIEKFFDDESVKITDPFTDRSYDAKMSKKSEHYTMNRPEHRFVVEIRELDLPPQFKILDINGQLFEVIKYEEDDHDDVIGRHAILRLSKEQLIGLQGLMALTPVQIKRVGVDAIPLSMRWGGAMYWSEHEEEDLTYYKQIVRFFPPDLPPSGRKFTLVPAVAHNALESMVIKLSARFEALINELTMGKVLSDEQRNRLLGKEWRELLDDQRITDILWQAEKVFDAEDQLL
jgi:hypothetical protein